MNNVIAILLEQIVKDLEITRHKYSGYAYVRTIRNILIGKEDAVIAPHFKEQYYHGVISELTLEETEKLLDSLVKEGKLQCIYTEHGKLYCTLEFYEDCDC